MSLGTLSLLFLLSVSGQCEMEVAPEGDAIPLEMLTFSPVLSGSALMTAQALSHVSCDAT